MITKIKELAEVMEEGEKEDTPMIKFFTNSGREYDILFIRKK